MKAVVVEEYTTIDGVRLKEVAKPEISSGKVRVRVQAVGIGFVDGLKVQGLYQTKDPLPFTPGSEFSEALAGRIVLPGARSVTDCDTLWSNPDWLRSKLRPRASPQRQQRG